MNAHERAVEALDQDIHNEYGWLSDAQHAQLRSSYDGTVEFCGEGSIDLHHLVSIVEQALKGDESNDTA